MLTLSQNSPTFAVVKTGEKLTLAILNIFAKFLVVFCSVFSFAEFSYAAANVCTLPIESGPYGCSPGPCQFRVQETNTYRVEMNQLPFAISPPVDSCLANDTPNVDAFQVPFFPSTNADSGTMSVNTREPASHTMVEKPPWVIFLENGDRLPTTVQFTYTRWVERSNPHPPVNCIGNWSGVCGPDGKEYYLITQAASNGGTACPETLGASRNCAVNCSGAWTACNAGSQTYQISQAALNGGASCPYSLNQTRSCNATCGSSHGQALPSAPATGLCSAGVPSWVTGTGPWNWSCTTEDGRTASCTASASATCRTSNYYLTATDCQTAEGKACTSVPMTGWFLRLVGGSVPGCTAPSTGCGLASEQPRLDEYPVGGCVTAADHGRNTSTGCGCDGDGTFLRAYYRCQVVTRWQCQ